MADEKLCLQWNTFQNNISSAFRDLRDDKHFADVTLACEDGPQIDAHTVVLISCSPFFQNLLQRSKHTHPINDRQTKENISETFEPKNIAQNPNISTEILRFAEGKSFNFPNKTISNQSMESTTINERALSLDTDSSFTNENELAERAKSMMLVSYVIKDFGTLSPYSNISDGNFNLFFVCKYSR